MSDGLTSFIFQNQQPVPVPTGADTSVAFPQWLQESIYGAIGSANQLAGTPYTQFPGPQVYTPSSQTQQSWNLAGQNVGSWQPNLNAAGALTQANAQPLSQSQINSYINPFENYVTGALNQNLMQNILPQVQSQFVSAGQAASPQQAQVAGQAIYNTQQAAGQALAGAYQGALNTATTEQGLGLTAGAQMGQLGALQQQLSAADTNTLNAAGTQQDVLSQANINAAMNNFYQQQQWPYQNLNFLSDIVRGLPWQAAGSNTQTVGTSYLPSSYYGASPLSTALGTAAQASALGLKRGGHVGALKRYSDGGGVDPNETSYADDAYANIFAPQGGFADEQEEPDEMPQMARGGALAHLRRAA